jgi:hypothetical protein
VVEALDGHCTGVGWTANRWARAHYYDQAL